MKKKIFNILLIAIFSILILETKVNASNIVSTDKQVNSGDGNVTISITSKETLGAYNLELVDNSGLELVSSSAGPSGTANGTKISGASATGITDLGSYTFKVPTVTSDTTYKIKFRITGIANVNDEDLPNVDNNAILTVKAPKQRHQQKIIIHQIMQEVQITTHQTIQQVQIIIVQQSHQKQD